MLPSTLGVAASFPPNLNSNIRPCPDPNSHEPRRKTATFHSPNQVIPLLRRCNGIDQFPPVHAAILKTGVDRDPLLLFKILRLCSAFRSMDYAARIFDGIENPDVYHYTALIGGKIVAASSLDAIRLYARMVGEHIEPDPVVIAYVLKACGFRLALEEGRQVHGQVLKLKLGSERPIRMKLMEFYGRCGKFDDARWVFGEMPERDAVAATILISCYSDRGLIEEAEAVFDGVQDKDTVCWTAMIDGCVRNGRANRALKFFREMQRENVRPNEFTVVCVLSACSQLGALELGRWVHSYVGKYNIRLNTFVGSALIDMYTKCGILEEAQEVFSELAEKDAVSYNSMIVGLAMNGRSYEAVELYRLMITKGLRPTHITFVAVLNACSHSGLVDMGFEIFESMVKDHGLEPQIEHYGCMVDLLGRVGRLEEAYEFIKRMSIEPDHVIWGALLGACKIHGNLTLGEKVARILIDSEAADSGTYVLLSNVYASFRKWEEAARIRTKMKERGIQKEPGCSSIEVDNEIHEFLLGDIRHPRREEIYRKLEELNDALKLEGYTPARDVVLQDIEEEEKEWALAIHGERLAICYGLISTKPGTTIRVVKNLRVCGDCHSMIKLISKVTKRKIVVRDRNRFHHFEDGSCSCRDYW
ncbi:putative pentatricopeptide repeat-containing protein At5g59200, chloroplastic [Phoenix dactylifera]|uniref:Pentatricopeptide repeat-containing protein At5g59200, chloroplastic n=1 Tax=Phoenix dactylifera TaxID=42345 RepID=A0A8B7BZ11_PHODC|nr:putative pentatricopeptide repeat-containing protein At5g59200, chloroplastic [Phoenix dactylifera]